MTGRMRLTLSALILTLLLGACGGGGGSSPATGVPQTGDGVVAGQGDGDLAPSAPEAAAPPGAGEGSPAAGAMGGGDLAPPDPEAAAPSGAGEGSPAAGAAGDGDLAPPVPEAAAPPGAGEGSPAAGRAQGPAGTPEGSFSSSDALQSAPTQEGEADVGAYTCSLSVRCDSILANMDSLNPEKAELVPQDGVIFPAQTAEFYEGETVFNLLQREMKKGKIHFDFVRTPAYDSVYIKGIQNLYELDCGELSGWVYQVNGVVPGYGCSQYTLGPGDVVEIVYSCDLGRDVGGGDEV